MPRKSTQTTAIEPSEQTAVDLGLILEDGQHPDDPAEREAMERGQAASKAMAEDEDKDADAEAIQEEVDGVVLAWRDRNARIVQMRREGKSLARIGQEFGLSGTRVYRICALAGVVIPPKPKAKKAPAKKK